MNYMTTYSGLHFTPVEPVTEDIRIEDIAHALSLLCRANGHIPTFFSVAQHCINCALEAEARGYSPRLQLACLLHDAGEAYVSDVTRPLKPYLPQYLEIEDRLLDAIWEKYLSQPLTTEERVLVFAVDDAQLYHEFEYFRKEWEFSEIAVLMGSPRFEERPFREVEEEYLELFRRLTEIQ